MKTEKKAKQSKPESDSWQPYGVSSKGGGAEVHVRRCGEIHAVRVRLGI